MKRKALAMMVIATGMILGIAAYAQETRDTPKAETGATHNHDLHCCKPEPGDMKVMQGLAGHRHDHAQVPKKPAAKKPARKPGVDASQNTR
jgi:hypothetical protein